MFPAKSAWKRWRRLVAYGALGAALQSAAWVDAAEPPRFQGLSNLLGLSKSQTAETAPADQQAVQAPSDLELPARLPVPDEEIAPLPKADAIPFQEAQATEQAEPKPATQEEAKPAPTQADPKAADQDEPGRSLLRPRTRRRPDPETPQTQPPQNSTQTETPDRQLLRRPLGGPDEIGEPEQAPLDTDLEPATLQQPPAFPTLGFAGPSGILPTETQTSSHFVPIEDRWRIGLPYWDRYGTGNAIVDDEPYELGHWWDAYNQNVLKGDYPIIGHHTFMNLTITDQQVIQAQELPAATTPFESTLRQYQNDFFGNNNSFAYQHYLKVSLSLFHGDAAFKPMDWQVRLTPVFNINYVDLEELAGVNPDVSRGRTRGRTFTALEEWFVEAKITDLSGHYDFLSVRGGSQFFVSDFRGFIFSDTNRAIRLFGTRLSNKQQFNVVWFDQTDKDTNSQLNSIGEDRHQNVLILNFFSQDFIWPGYTTQLSYHYNNDGPSFKFDKNNFLVRPDPVGVFTPHRVEAHYLGWAGDGHIGRYNISHAFYWVLGHDSLNPLAGTEQDINAQMGAIELSYDRDWVRLRASLFYASGDKNIEDGQAEGFDSIFDNPNFAGGPFSFWQRQQIQLLGAKLTNQFSLVPDLRNSKIQGQSNFVNPGLWLYNVGVDFEITPKLRSINNVNFLWFDENDVLERFVFQDNISRQLGVDLSTGIEYRPFLNDNVILLAGLSGFIPGPGFKDLYNDFETQVDTMIAGFMELILQY